MTPGTLHLGGGLPPEAAHFALRGAQDGDLPLFDWRVRVRRIEWAHVALLLDHRGHGRLVLLALQLQLHILQPRARSGGGA